jgi:cellulose synthase operon protein C
VRDSLAALAKLRPARWARAERVEEGVVPLDPVKEEKALAADAQRAKEPEPWNRLGLSYRRLGRFEDARRAWQQASTLRPGYASPVLNLAILDDLYLGQPARALAGYERFQAMVSPAEPQVARWMAELKNRKPAVGTATAGVQR